MTKTIENCSLKHNFRIQNNYLICFSDSLKICAVLFFRLIISLMVISGFCFQLKKLGNIVEDCKAYCRNCIVIRRPVVRHLE